ncbi:MMPL family transporter [Paenibacillus pasadenensis]|uniref:MMPL family transporter n=1 Tax=Paenibacillus pasadenensis TaxID=217090 RepID=UPI00204195B5|nr:MMPL family transporter [Paenibacillus pasadenensis]MCM3748476.1 MMPL family transporter [Paenibacillus pasadenensis]
MSRFLYRLGKNAYDKPWAYIAGWLVILGIVVATIVGNGINISSEMKIEGTESQKVLDQLEQVMPAASGAQASVVFTAPKGERLDTEARLAAIGQAVNKVYGLDYVINPAELAAKAGGAAGSQQQGDAKQQAQGGAAQQQAGGAAQTQSGGTQMELPPYGPLMVNGMPVPGMLIANDGSVALFQFQLTTPQSALSQEMIDSIVDAISVAEKDTGISALPSDSLRDTEVPVGTNEIYGLVVAGIVLVMTLGSLVGAGLPLAIALVGVGIGVGGALALSSFVTMSSVTPILALMVGLAVGIDYALFIVNRQRRLIFDQGLTAREAASRAVGTAGSAVFFAGLTVIIALCGMLVIGITFLSMMALVASATVLLNVLSALTLLPALLGLVGERICSPKARQKSASAAKRRGIAEGWAKGIVRFRWLVIVGIIAILGAAAIPTLEMRMGIPSGATANLDTPARQSYDAISAGFGEGFNGQLLLVAEPKDAGKPITQEVLGQIIMEIQKNKGVSIVSPVYVSDKGNMAILSAIPKTGPTDEETSTLVEELRSSDSVIAKDLGIQLGVTGFTAINIDMSAKLTEAFPLYIGVIVILSLIILLLVFRSILVPVKATVGFLLSVLATFGLTTAVFQWGWLRDLFGFDTGGPLLSFIPILVTGILYGLAMDYQVFLVSSMRESYIHGHKGKSSVIHGYDQASKVVVAAAIIMVSVFAGFIFTHDIMIKQIGFALAIGILIDAFVIRMAFVPAVMAIFGDRAWWLPRWLDRILPNLDVEGDKLIAELQNKAQSEGGAAADGEYRLNP